MTNRMLSEELLSMCVRGNRTVLVLVLYACSAFTQARCQTAEEGLPSCCCMLSEIPAGGGMKLFSYRGTSFGSAFDALEVSYLAPRFWAGPYLTLASRRATRRAYDWFKDSLGTNQVVHDKMNASSVPAVGLRFLPFGGGVALPGESQNLWMLGSLQLEVMASPWARLDVRDDTVKGNCFLWDAGATIDLSGLVGLRVGCTGIHVPQQNIGSGLAVLPARNYVELNVGWQVSLGYQTLDKTDRVRDPWNREQVFSEAPILSRRTLSALAAGLGDTECTVKAAALCSLAGRRDARAFEPVFSFLMNEAEDCNLRLQAFGTLDEACPGWLGQKEARHGLQQIARSDKNSSVLARAVGRLAGVGDTSALTLALRAIYESRLTLRTTTELFGSSARARLLLYTKDRDEPVRYASALFLAEMGELGPLHDISLENSNPNRFLAACELAARGDAEPLRAILRETGNPDRAGAAGALTARKDTASVGILIDLLEDAGNPVLAETAIRCLATLGDPAAIGPLTKALKGTLRDRATVALASFGSRARGAAPVLADVFPIIPGHNELSLGTRIEGDWSYGYIEDAQVNDQIILRSQEAAAQGSPADGIRDMLDACGGVISDQAINKALGEVRRAYPVGTSWVTVEPVESMEVGLKPYRFTLVFYQPYRHGGSTAGSISFDYSIYLGAWALHEITGLDLGTDKEAWQRVVR